MINNGDLIDKKYRIISEIGHGGMAVVYLAHDEKLQRNVALKVLPPSFAHDTGCVEAFINEAKKAAALNHPNIVKIYAVDKLPGGLPYFAIEFLKDSLHSRFKSADLSLPEKLKAISEVLKGLVYAHDKGFVHRDIKPENIMFNEAGEAIIIDFGIAKASMTSQTMTGEGMTKGTPSYMSPEQCKGKKLDARSDLYSIGIVLYEAATGRVPFEAEETTSLMYLHVHEPPDIDRLYAAGVHTGLIKVITKALAKDPSDRFQTASEFLAALNDGTFASVKKPPQKIQKAGLARALFIMALICLAGVLFYVGHKNYYLKPGAAVSKTENIPAHAASEAHVSTAGTPAISGAGETTSTKSPNRFGSEDRTESAPFVSAGSKFEVKTGKDIFEESKKLVRDIILSGKTDELDKLDAQNQKFTNEYGYTAYQAAFYENSSETLVTLAVRSGSPAMLDKIIRDSSKITDMTGANFMIRAVNWPDGNKDTPLMLAAAAGNEVFIEKLLQAGADASMQNRNGETATTLAAKKGLKKTSDLLKIWECNQSLFKAIFKADAGAVKNAVSSGANVNFIWFIPVYGSEGEYAATPLHAALEYYRVDHDIMRSIIIFLFARGADKNLKAGSVGSAYERAQNYLNKDIQNLFKNWSFPVNLEAPEFVKYQTAVQGLRIRQEPYTNSDNNIVTELDEGEIVYYVGPQTVHMDSVPLRGVVRKAPWYYVRVGSGKEGWIFSGGLK